MVERVVLLVGRVESLQRRVELEALHAQIFDEVLGAIDGLLALARIDRAEGDEDVVVAGAAFDDLLDRVRLMLESGGGIDGEHNGGHVPIAVALGDDVELRRTVLSLEVLGRCLGQGRGQGVVAVVGLLDVHVDVDGRLLDEFGSVLVAHAHCSFGASSSGSGGKFSPTDWRWPWNMPAAFSESCS